MKNKTMVVTRVMAGIAVLCLLLLCITGFAQSSDAQPKPIKKTTTAPVSNTGNTKPAPWEKQRIEPVKNKPANTTTKTNTKPEQAQPIQHK